MLVLSQKLGQRIYIGKDREIVLTVVDIGRNRVKLGIEAPRDIPVIREELAELTEVKKQESK